MAIRVEHSPGAIAGVAAYASGVGKAKERRSKRALDVLREQERYRQQQLAQARQNQFRLGLENRRNEFDLARDARRDTARRAEMLLGSDLRREEMDLASDLRTEERTGVSSERMWREEYERMQDRLDVLNDLSRRGQLRGTFAENWHAAQAKLKSVLSDKNLTPAQRYEAYAIQAQDVLNEFNELRDVTPYEDLPGARTTEDGIIYRNPLDPNQPREQLGFESPEAAGQFFQKNTYVDEQGNRIWVGPRDMMPELLPSGSDDRAALQHMRKQGEAIKQLQAERQRQHEQAVRNLPPGSQPPPPPDMNFSEEEVAERMRAMDAFDDKVRQLYGGQAVDEGGASGDAPSEEKSPEAQALEEVLRRMESGTSELPSTGRPGETPTTATRSVSGAELAKMLEIGKLLGPKSKPLPPAGERQHNALYRMPATDGRHFVGRWDGGKKKLKPLGILGDDFGERPVYEQPETAFTKRRFPGGM